MEANTPPGDTPAEEEEFLVPVRTVQYGQSVQRVIHMPDGSAIVRFGVLHPGQSVVGPSAPPAEGHNFPLSPEQVQSLREELGGDGKADLLRGTPADLARLDAMGGQPSG